MHTLYTTCFLLLILATPFALQGQYDRPAEIGKAIFYADQLEGQATASGEAYRIEGFTAAHPSYPMGTQLKVTRLDNYQSVSVRVNDRMVPNSGRIITLSKAAAFEIGLVAAGHALVRVEPDDGSATPDNSNSATADYSISYGGYTSRSATAPANYGQGAQNQESFSSEFPLARKDAYSYRSAANEYSTNYARQEEQLTARSPYSSGVAPSAPSAYNDQGGQESWTARSPGTANAKANAMAIPEGTQGYAVQLASYSELTYASGHVEQLKKKGFNGAYIWPKDGKYRVVLAPFQDRGRALDYLNEIRSRYYMDGLVIMLK